MEMEKWIKKQFRERKTMKTSRYEVTVFDSESNSRFIVSMFATCMTHAAFKAKEILINKGMIKEGNACIRNIYKCA